MTITTPLTLNICKLCLDLRDPLDPGIYVILHDDHYQTIIVDKSGENIHDYTYKRSTNTLEDVINELHDQFGM